MYYIIDGYNLLFRILSGDEGLKERRERVIQNLNKKIQLTGIDVLIVFDSSYRLDESTKSHYNYLEIQFTSQGITADDWIIEAVQRSSDPGKIIVVSSDKKLTKAVCAFGGKSETVELFTMLLNKRYQNKLRDKPKKIKTEIKPLNQLGVKNTHKIEHSEEGSFEYYLNAFEDNFNKMQKPKKPSKIKLKAKPKKHQFVEDTPKEKRYGSEMERWQDLFENR